MRKLAAGNWKMNGLAEQLAEISALAPVAQGAACEVLICPPATLLSRMSAAAQGLGIQTGGQDCHWNAEGAHTGDVSAKMLVDAGARYVIVGHSERRADHAEEAAHVRQKAEAAQAAGLIAIICVGETEAQRDAGNTLGVVGAQLAASVPETATAANSVVAYEPVWAIGTGRTPSLPEIEEVHRFMRAELATRFGAQGAAIRLLYGGSVKPANAADIFALEAVDGALVGGASLKASDFGQIVQALSAAS